MLSLAYLFSFAQLSAPSQSDTLCFIYVEYDGVSIELDNLSYNYLVETPTKIVINKNTYKKGKLTNSQKGVYAENLGRKVDAYLFENASINGKTTEICILRYDIKGTNSRTLNNSIFMVDNYQFWCVPYKDWKEVNKNEPLR